MLRPRAALKTAATGVGVCCVLWFAFRDPSIDPGAVHRAIEARDAVAVRQAIDRGFPLDYRFHNWKPTMGYTCLHLACRSAAPEIVKALLDAGADPNETDNTGQHSLNYCVGNDNGVDCMLPLLNAGARPDEPGRSGTTPLTVAALYCHPRQVTLLAEWGADVNRKTDGMTALCYAVAPSLTTNDFEREQQLETVGALLVHGASVKSCDGDESVVSYAKSIGAADAVIALLEESLASSQGMAPEGSASSLQR